MNQAPANVRQHREQLLKFYQQALRAVSGEAAVERFLQQRNLNEPCSLIAVGKAAPAMALGAVKALGDKLRSGLVITRQGYSDPRLNIDHIRQIESAHPIPDASSLHAGGVLLDFLQQLPAGEPLLFLLSGGASALVEVLPEKMSVEELAKMNRWLLASGLSIHEMNIVRKRVSRIKGGKLLPMLHGRTTLQLLISDVPGDDLMVIGSGPLIVHSVPEAVTPSLPPWLQSIIDELPQDGVESHQHVESHLVAGNELARKAVLQAAQKLTIPVYDHPGHFQGDAALLAKEFCRVMEAGPAGIYLWGGESSVVLPEEPGRGGRSQHLALHAAQQLAGRDNILLLAAATDGSDGSSEDAGAVVDGQTLSRGEDEGFGLKRALQQADSGSFLEASGDLIQTGPTGTNVIDLVIGWKW